ncbi:hypothetical protein K8R33_04050 [archaeon]|nr:hypothetical protein [archaeon]
METKTKGSSINRTQKHGREGLQCQYLHFTAHFSTLPSTAYIRNFMKDGKLYPLENDRFTTIEPKIIKKFSVIVKEYFKEKNS